MAEVFFVRDLLRHLQGHSPDQEIEFFIDNIGTRELTFQRSENSASVIVDVGLPRGYHLVRDPPS